MSQKIGLLTASQKRRTEASEMKLLKPLAGYTLYDHKTNYIRRELQITGILDKIEEYRRNWFQHLHRMPQNRIPLKSYVLQTTREVTLLLLLLLLLLLTFTTKAVYSYVPETNHASGVYIVLQQFCSYSLWYT